VKFLLDHDVPDDLSYLLEQLGHHVTLLRKALPRDSSDEAVFRFAHEAGCILLTRNRTTFCIWQRPSHTTASSLSSGAEPEERSVSRCFGCSTVPARQASETTSASPDRRENDLRTQLLG
jgi:hypothetical protein